MLDQGVAVIKWRWLITVHRGYITVRIPILQVAAGVLGLGIALVCAGVRELTW